jgi:hypothetical protein
MTPDEPRPQPVLASDAERERSITVLRDAVGEGRLTLEEFTQRMELATTARTDLELAELARDLPAAPPQASTDVAQAPQEHRALFSHIIRKGPWSLPRSSSWRSLFGTIDLDLRQARLASTDSDMHVHNFFGTVTVIVPDGVQVDVQGGGLFASQKIENPEHPPVAGAARLTIHCSGPGGTLYVRSRPASSFKDTVKKAIKGRE